MIRAELGSPINIKADCRAAFGVHVFDEFRRQLSYAARLLRKTPAFTATALLTLAVCFGANLTIFAVIDSVLLRPMLSFAKTLQGYKSRPVTMLQARPHAIHFKSILDFDEGTGFLEREPPSETTM